MKRLLLAAIISANSAFASDPCSEAIASLAPYELLDPVTEAISSAKKTNPKFLGVYGYALETPGIPGFAYCWLEAGLVYAIPGTGDDLCSAEHEKLQTVVSSYARQYNAKLIRPRSSMTQIENTRFTRSIPTIVDSMTDFSFSFD